MTAKRIKAKDAKIGMVLYSSNRDETITKITHNEDDTHTIHTRYFYGSLPVESFCRFDSKDTFRIII
jgi:hypothetical protein